MSDAATISILIDIKARLDELTKLDQGIKQTTDQASTLGQIFKNGLGIGTGIQIATAAIAMFKGAIISGIKDSMAMATEVKNNSQALGINAEAYQVLVNLVESTGGQLTNLTQAISFNNQTLADAAKGTGAAAAAYRGLGINVQQFSQLPIERRFEVIGQAILHSKDQTTAYGEASQILGSRNIRFLMNALQQLAKDGYGTIDAAMVKSGKIMSDDSIARLAAGQLAIDQAKKGITVGWGSMLAYGSSLLDSVKKDPWGTLLSIGSPSALMARVATNVTPQTLPEQPPTPPVPVPVQQTAEWRANELEILKAETDAQVNQADNLITEANRRRNLIPILKEQIQDYKALLDLLQKAPLADNETQADRDVTVEKLDAKILILQKQLTDAKTGPPSAVQKSRNSFNNINNPEENPNYLTAKGGFFSGFMDWASSAGSVGQQISASIQSTLGTTVQGISQGITEWATTGKISLGTLQQMGLQVFSGFVQSIVQMGVQWGIEEIFMTSTTAAGASARRVIRLGETLFHGVQVGIRVAAHLAGEVLQTGITVAQAGARIIAIMAESAVYLIKAAIEALAALASIPYVGPFLAIAAMGAILKAGYGVMKGHAEGGMVNGPGGPTDDRVLARVSNGEWIAPAWQVQSPVYGPMIAALDEARTGTPGFSLGGSVASFFNRIQPHTLFGLTKYFPHIGPDWLRPENLFNLDPKHPFLTTTQLATTDYLFGAGKYKAGAGGWSWADGAHAGGSGAGAGTASGTGAGSLDDATFSRNTPSTQSAAAAVASGGAAGAGYAPGAASPMAVILLTDDLTNIRNIKRQAGWDSAVVESVIRNKAVILRPPS